MIKIKSLLAGTLAFTALICGSTANAVTVNTLVFQGVTWTSTSVDADSMTLRIQNAVSSGTGNWANITHLWTLSINPTGTVGSATLNPGSISSNGLELNNGGCSGGASGKACFTFSPVELLTDDMTFTIDFVGTGLNMDQVFHVKVGFLCGFTATPTRACGSLMSRDISSSTSSTSTSSSSGNEVPEPGTLSLFGLGLLGLGYGRRLAKSK